MSYQEAQSLTNCLGWVFYQGSAGHHAPHLPHGRERMERIGVNFLVSGLSRSGGGEWGPGVTIHWLNSSFRFLDQQTPWSWSSCFGRKTAIFVRTIAGGGFANLPLRRPRPRTRTAECPGAKCRVVFAVNKFDYEHKREIQHWKDNIKASEFPKCQFDRKNVVNRVKSEAIWVEAALSYCSFQ